MGMRFSPFTKSILLVIFLASLVGFGGRGGFGLSVLGLLPLALAGLRDAFRKGLSMLQLFLLITAVLVVPIVLCGGLYLLLTSDMGERLMAMSSLQDESAQGRWLAFKVFNYMSADEILLGTTTERVFQIAYRMGLSLPISDIENPWILMLMFLGALVFPVWCLATLAFAIRLIWGQPLALKIAVVAYFIVASTSNSFGRKDSIYLLMVGAVICAARSLEVSSRRPERAAVPEAVEATAQPAPAAPERFSEMATRASA
jgi:hypothetical protein